jgi:hypothetical protein
MQPEGKLLVELTTAFGAAVETLVIKHGKSITEQQSQLGRCVPLDVLHAGLGVWGGGPREAVAHGRE